MTSDRLVGMTLLVVAALLVIVGGLWSGRTAWGCWVAGFIVVTGVSAGLFGERVARRR